MNLPQQRDPTGVCAFCPNGCCFSIPVRIPTLSSYPPCIQMTSGSPASHMDSPLPDLVDHIFSNFFYIVHVFLNDFKEWRWVSPLLMEGTGHVIHAPERGAHLPALSAASSADALLTDRPPRAVSIPTHGLQLWESRGRNQNKGCSFGESGAQKQEKGQSWSRQADL